MAFPVDGGIEKKTTPNAHVEGVGDDLCEGGYIKPTGTNDPERRSHLLSLLQCHMCDHTVSNLTPDYRFIFSR